MVVSTPWQLLQRGVITKTAKVAAPLVRRHKLSGRKLGDWTSQMGGKVPRCKFEPDGSASLS